MEFDFWWVVAALPVFFGMGWMAARVDLKSLLSESREVPSSYFRGLNFLLSEQQDKAIEAFLAAAMENPQTAELQFALGSLFRRRGEADRAIRMHQDLIAREDLPAADRRRASRYHCSRYNTQTKRLTQEMFEQVFSEICADLAIPNH